MEVSATIDGVDLVMKTMRLIDGRLSEGSVPVMESIGQRIVGELRANLTAQGLVKTGALRDSVAVLYNNGLRIRVGAKGKLQRIKARVHHYGGGYPKKSGKRGLRVPKREWIGISAGTTDWAASRIASFMVAEGET